MANSEADTRRHIMEAARGLMEETADIEKITVRQIAQRAGVGVGLLNYHFSSKDNLLGLVVGEEMAGVIEQHMAPQAAGTAPPADRLKTMLRALYTLGMQQGKWIRFLLTRALMDGSMEAPLYLVPLLREIFGPARDDMQLRILALQLLYPIQVTGLHQDKFKLYSGIDLADEAQQGRFIDQLVDNLL